MVLAGFDKSKGVSQKSIRFKSGSKNFSRCGLIFPDNNIAIRSRKTKSYCLNWKKLNNFRIDSTFGKKIVEPIVNVTKILQLAFAPVLFCQKITKLTVGTEKLCTNFTLCT